MSQPASAGQPPTGCAGVSVSSPAEPAAFGIASRLIAWQRRSGRHGLPWQATREPYHVWLSEIMLQQTRVATVLDYYPRFLQQFPSLASNMVAACGGFLIPAHGLGHVFFCTDAVFVAIAQPVLPGNVARFGCLREVGESGLRILGDAFAVQIHQTSLSRARLPIPPLRPTL